jgi:hypothetical protein
MTYRCDRRERDDQCSKLNHVRANLRFRPFGRLRRTRNQIEYDDISAVTADDVHADATSVRTLLTMATQLAPMLPVFTD